MNMVYMPTGRNIWRKVAAELYSKSIEPKIWLGDPVHEKYAKEKYKNCTVLDYNSVHKSIVCRRNNFNLASKNINSKYFYTLKDQVYKAMDRQDDFGVFGRLEREAVFYSLFYYFYTLVAEKKINILVSSEGAHSPAGMILYGVCKIMGVRTYHLAQNSLMPIAHVCTDFYGGKLKVQCDFDFSNHKEVIRNYASGITDEIPTPYYMKLQSIKDKKSKGKFFKFKRYFIMPIKNFIFNRHKEYGYNVYRRDFFNANHRPVLYERIVDSRKKDLFSAYRSSLSNIDLERKFVYVPLHYEPERTTNPDGGEFYNIYDMIMCLRSFLPENVVIILKEHSSQFTNKMHGYQGRSPLFYEAIKSLENTFFVDMKVTSSELIKKSIFVATQTGSAALEAALMNKKSLVFGTPWFLGAPNIYSYKETHDYEKFMESEVIDKKNVENYLISYVSDYAIPACVNPSGESYFKKKFGDAFSELIDDEFFAEIFTDIVYKDYKSFKAKIPE